MAKAKKKAAPKTAKAKAAKKTTQKANDEVKLNKLVLAKKKGGAAPETDDDKVAAVVHLIQQITGQEYVRAGQVTLILADITKVAANAGDARDMIANAYDSGVINAA